MPRQKTPPPPPATLEEWRDVPGFPGYQVSDRGNVRSLDRIVTTANGKRRALKGRPLKPQPNQDAYLVAKLCIGGLEWSKLVHVLVARTFIGEPPCDNAQVHHANRNRQDNRLCNLSWQSGAEHLARHFIGENNPAAKLTKATISEIRRLLAQGQSQRQVARKFDINQSNISRAVAGITWKHIYVAPEPNDHGQLNLFLEFEITELVELEY